MSSSHLRKELLTVPISLFFPEKFQVTPLSQSLSNQLRASYLEVKEWKEKGRHYKWLQGLEKVGRS